MNCVCCVPALPHCASSPKFAIETALQLLNDSHGAKSNALYPVAKDTHDLAIAVRHAVGELENTCGRHFPDYSNKMCLVEAKLLPIRLLQFSFEGNCMFSRFVLGLLAFSGLCWQVAAPANGGLIVENTAGTSVTAFGGIFGHSFTTPTGGPWVNIRFNFINGSDNAVAAGGLYALSQQYSGTPNSLSTSTTGFLGFTNVISAGQWQFSGLTLNPGTQYFFYMDNFTTETLKFSLTNPYTGGLGYNAVGPTTNYLTIGPNFDLNFTVQGDIVAVPEPSSLVFLSLIAGGCGLCRWRTRGRKNEESFAYGLSGYC